MAVVTATPSSSSYPLTFSVDYPEDLSRWLIFVKWLFAIPHFFALYLIGIASWAATIFAWFSILFTKRYPKGLFDFQVGVQRWNANVGAYLALMRDEYPPFSWDAGEYPLAFDIEYPQELSRWLIFVKWLLAIPHIIALIFLGLAAFGAEIGAWFSILFTKRYPRGLFDFVAGVYRWQYRVTAYVNLMRDDYPPFSLNA